MRVALAILAACLFVGCGSARNQTGGVSTPGNPGLIAFGGVLEPGALHPPSSYYALRPDGTGLQKLAFTSDDWDLSFSADGRFASMSQTSPDGSSGVVVSRADGSERQVVPLPKNGDATGPSLSPDGKSVAIAYTPDTESGQRDLWTVSVDGRGLERLSSTGAVMSVAWSPDGTRIAFMDGSANDYGADGAIGAIYVVGTDGSDLHQIARGFTGVGQGVAWSPDGTRIAFEDAQQQVAIVDANGENVEVVSPEGEAPAWSPDGKRLAFLRVTSCPGYTACTRSRIFVVDVGGGTPREVGPKFGDPTSLSWTTATLEPGADAGKRQAS